MPGIGTDQRIISHDSRVAHGLQLVMVRRGLLHFVNSPEDCLKSVRKCLLRKVKIVTPSTSERHILMPRHTGTAVDFFFIKRFYFSHLQNSFHYNIITLFHTRYLLLYSVYRRSHVTINNCTLYSQLERHCLIIKQRYIIHVFV
jgi:hypothetical protein